MIDTRNVLLKCRNPVRSMLRYDAAAGHVVLLECHHSFSAFSDSGCTTVRSRVVSFLGGQNIHVLNLQVPGSNIAMDWLVQHPTDQYTHQKCRKYIHLCLRLFLSHLRVFSAHFFVNLLRFRNAYPGSHGTHSSPFPTTVFAFVLIGRKRIFRIKFLSLASACVELVCIHPTYQCNKQHAGC